MDRRIERVELDGSINCDLTGRRIQPQLVPTAHLFFADGFAAEETGLFSEIVSLSSSISMYAPCFDHLTGGAHLSCIAGFLVFPRLVLPASAAATTAAGSAYSRLPTRFV